MSKNKIIKILFFTIIFYICMVAGIKVKAAPLSISVSTSNATVGDSVKITITSEYTGRVNISTSGGNLSESRVWVENNSQTVTLTSDSEGTIKITASAEGGMLSNNGVDVSVGDQGASVTFSKKQTTPEPAEPETPPAKSNNANLKNLGIRPNDFKGFKSGTTSYNVTVPNNVDKVEVYAVKADEKATVTGTGNKSLNVGKNALTVEVTAEDGTKKTYTINVTREEKTETTNNTTNETTNEVANTTTNETANNVQSEPTVTNSDLVSLSVEGYTITPKFSPNIYEYKLNLTSTDVTELNVIAKSANDNVKIDIAGNKDLKDGENLITILVQNAVTNETSTYQIIVNKSNIDLDEVNNTLGKNTEKVNIIRGILLGVIALIIIGAVVFIVVMYRKKQQMKYNSKYEYEDDDDDDEVTYGYNNSKKQALEELEENEEIEKPKAIRKLEETIQNEETEEPKENSEQEEATQKEESAQTEENINDEDIDWKSNRKNNGKGKHF